MSLNSTIFEGIALVAVAESAVSIMAPALDTNDRMDQIGTESHEFGNIGCIFNGNMIC